MNNPQDSARIDEISTGDDSPAPLLAQMPECCNSGCRFCVLDYPELFTSRQASDAEVRAESELARALERAEEILYHLDSEGEI